MRRTRFLPWPMSTYESAPVSTWPLSVLIEQPSLAAASAFVRRPSGGGDDGARLCRSARHAASPAAHQSATARESSWGSHARCTCAHAARERAYASATVFVL